MRRYKKKRQIFSILVLLILVIAVFLAWPSKKTSNNNSLTNSPASSSNGSSATASQSFNKNLYPTDQASSLWVVVNKGRALPSSYIPANLVTPNVPLRLGAANSEMHLRADTAAALEKMFTAAKAAGIYLQLESGYRSYSEQVSVYQGYVNTDGVSKADTYSARPGHSEHQTGLAADIEPLSRNCEVQQCFDSTPEGKWLAANCYSFGFIIRYQKNTQNLTGYEYEPWHVRFVGTDLAAQIHQSGQTLEQFFGLPSYTTYPAQSLELNG